MNRLIEALQIFAKYKNLDWPTHCEHDVLMVMGVGEFEPSEEDRRRLDELDFIWDEGYEAWISFHFGRA